VAYRAEIEIVAKGVTKITQLQKSLNQLATQIDHLSGPGSLGDFNKQLAQATKLMGRAQQGTVEEKRAIQQYVTALKNANGAQERTNKLIADEIRQRDGATAALKRYNAAAVPGRQPGGSMAGRYVRPGSAASRTQFSSPIGPEPGVQFGSTTQFGPTPLAEPESIFRGQSSAVEGRIKRILAIKRDELQLEKSLIDLQQKSIGLDAKSIRENNRLLNLKAEEVAKNKEIIRQERVKQSILRKRRRLEAAGRGPGRGRRGRGGGGGGGLGAAIGFPLLFGAGPASVLGAVAGSAGGFGGQIFGSAIGQQIDQAVGAIARLGQALNPLTADLDAVVNAAGKSGTEFEKLIKKLEEVAGAEAALKAASEQLAIQIGEGGVGALKQFGEESAELGNTFAVTLTQISAAVAELINKTGFLRGIIDNLARDNDLRAGIANTSDPQLQELKAARQSFIKESGGVFYEEDMKPFEDRIILRQRELAIEKELTAQSRIRAGIQEAQVARNEPELQRLQAQLEIEESGLDLTTRKGLQAALAVKSKELDSKIQSEIEKGVSKEVLKLRRKLALLKIVNQAKEERGKKDEEDGRRADLAQRKEEQRQKKLNAAAISLLDVSVEARELDAGRLAAIDRELQFIGRKQGFIEENIRLSEKDLQVQQMLLDASGQKMRNKERELELERARIKLAQQSQIDGISRSGEDFRRGIANESAGIALGMQDPFGTSQQVQEQVLALEQLERRTAALLPLERELNDLKRAAQELKGKESTEATKDRQARIDELNAVIQKNSEALAGLEQLELAQSRYNRALEAAKPFADAFTNGLLDGITGLVEGTKTAEQAFADFLRTIADMLMQAAKQMITQYIAIGIARMFAMGTSANPGGKIGLGGPNPGGNSGFADGGVFAKNGIIPYAKGGIVNKPTMFAYGDGGAGRFGLMGEAGPEAILPLKRGPGGRLGVESSGEVGNVVVNVDAKGTAVQGDDSRADQLGRLIGAAVQAELIKQKRPGGLLTR
jgi:phage-related minor tail protein